MNFVWHGEKDNSMAKYRFSRGLKNGIKNIFDDDRQTYLRKKFSDKGSPVELEIIFSPPLMVENVEILLNQDDEIFDQTNFQGNSF